jgi:hypothetical protein
VVSILRRSARAASTLQVSTKSCRQDPVRRENSARCSSRRYFVKIDRGHYFRTEHPPQTCAAFVRRICSWRWYWVSAPHHPARLPVPNMRPPTLRGRRTVPGNLGWSCLWCNTWQSERTPGAIDHGGHYPAED